MGGEQQTIKYWDPQASSVKKFVDLGLGTAEQYSFSALSNKLLGQTQPNQFQSDTDPQPTGWWWGTKCTPIYDESNPPKIINTTCDSSAAVVNNVLAEIPREYHRKDGSFGGSYNVFASSAESTNSIASLTDAPDSICPAGWELPSGFTDVDGSWNMLVYSSYSLQDTSTDDEASFRKSPISPVRSGAYVDSYLRYPGDFLVGTKTNYDSTHARRFAAWNGRLVLQNVTKIEGVTVRCIIKK